MFLPMLVVPYDGRSSYRVVWLVDLFLVNHLARTLSLLYSCLIARNLMNGQKTCLEVFQYMNHSENKLSTGIGDGVDCMLEGGSKGDEIVVSIFYWFRVCLEVIFWWSVYLVMLILYLVMLILF